MKFKVNWSTKSHSYNKTEKKIVLNVMDNADPLTQGNHLKKFEKDFKKYLGASGKVFGVTSGCKCH